MRDPVGLLGFSDQIEMFVKPKLGTSQVFYIAKQIFDKIEIAREHPQKRAAKFSLPLLFMASRLKMRHSVIFISDVVDLVNDDAAIDFKLLRLVAAKHDMMMLILDDPDEFRLRSRLGYIRISDMETGKQTVISARKAGAIRRDIEERRAGAPEPAEARERRRLGGADAGEPRGGAAAVPDLADGALSGQRLRASGRPAADESAGE